MLIISVLTGANLLFQRSEIRPENLITTDNKDLFYILNQNKFWSGPPRQNRGVDWKCWNRIRKSSFIIRHFIVSLERRWSIHSFRYGCLVTTLSLLPALPSPEWSGFGYCRLSWHDGRWVQDPRTYSTRHGWCAFTSDSNFTESSCRLRSELGAVLADLLHLAVLLLIVPPIVARVQPWA